MVGIRRSIASALFAVATFTINAQQPNHGAQGSITIDGIAEIKYPSDPRWSPDGKTIAVFCGTQPAISNSSVCSRSETGCPDELSCRPEFADLRYRALRVGR